MGSPGSLRGRDTHGHLYVRERAHEQPSTPGTRACGIAPGQTRATRLDPLRNRNRAFLKPEIGRYHNARARVWVVRVRHKRRTCLYVARGTRDETRKTGPTKWRSVSSLARVTSLIIIAGLLFFPVPRLCGLASCMLARASTTFLPLRAHACTHVGTCAYSTCRRSRGNVNACIHTYALYGRTEKNEFRCARRGQRRLGTSHDDHRRLFPSALYFLGVSRDSKNTLPLLTFGNYSPLTLVLLSRDLIYVFVCTLVEELLCFRILLSMYLSTK